MTVETVAVGVAVGVVPATKMGLGELPHEDELDVDGLGPVPGTAGMMSRAERTPPWTPVMLVFFFSAANCCRRK